MDHEFGGAWTQKKLAILGKYLSFYTQALKNMGFTLHYVDAFAGTGSHIPDTDGAQLSLIDKNALQGSVKAALQIEPGFHHYHFNDLNPDHVAELEKLKSECPGKTITITQKDANEFVPEFCRSLSKNDRAVLFLDPYSTQLNWDILKEVAATEKIDVWLLFPISVIVRMMPNEADRIKPEWNETLTRLLGTDEWQSALYVPIEEPAIKDLFGDVSSDASDSKERLNWRELQNWVTKRLKDLFPYVAEPVELKNNNRPLFSFYFLVSNKSEKAQQLANKVAKSILQNEK